MTIKPEAYPPLRFMRRVYPLVSVPSYRWRAEILAFHEAGHAVYCDVMGIPYTAIEIKPNKGRVLLDDDAILAAPPIILTKPEKERATCQIAAMYAAGKQAELLFLGLLLDGVMLPDDSDHRHACRWLFEQFGSAAPLGYCQQLARATLSQHWNEVERLAARLPQVGRLEFTTENKG